MRLKILIILVFLISGINLFSQQTRRYKDKIDYSYETAKDLYEKGMYASAQKIFAQILMDPGPEYSAYKDDAAYYIAMSSMELFNLDAEYQLQNFMEKHPESNNIDEASFQMANYHFRNKKYKNAIEWYNKTKWIRLIENQQSEYFFKLGFSHFARKDFDLAAKTFYEIKEKQDNYGIMSLYFYSHIKYINAQYETALQGFLELEKNPVFSSVAPYYIVQIYYLQERYNNVIEYAPALMDTITGPREAEIAKLLGSSYYLTGHYGEAIPYLKKYMATYSDINDFDNYELGFAYYKTQQYDLAATTLSKIKIMGDTISQNAAYIMGDCYIKLDKKIEARRAFETASLYNFNPDIREDALFNFAQLSFELSFSPFNEAINAFTQYINEYSNSLRTDKAYDYLVDAFLSTKNYKQAIAIIEKMKNRNSKIDMAYQRLTYYRGLELFTELNYTDAIKMFDKSLNYKIYDKDINALSHYWKAESNYRLNNINEAIDQFKEFVNSTGSLRLEEYGRAHYNLGYAYFNKKEYASANSWFRRFEMHEKDKNTAIMNDALNRIGDCYFIAKEFKPAAEYYKKASAIGLIESDYSLYQMSLSYGGLKQPEQKIWSLKKLLNSYPDSEYSGNANFEIARTYHTTFNNLDSAKYYYNSLIVNYPNSSMKKASLSSLGAVYFSQREFNRALDIYKQVIAEYPNTEEASNANEMIRTIYIELDKTEEYIDFANSGVPGVSVSRDEQDEIMWLAAKKLYIDQKYEDALGSLTNYLEKFPSGIHYIEANYFKAEISFYNKNYDDALVSYKIVADASRGSYTEESTLRTAGLLFDKEDWHQAYNYYEKLYPVAENKSTKLIAAIGRLRCSYNSENYDNVISAAVDIIENEKSNEEQIREAYYKMAKSYYNKNNNIRALGLFEDLSKEVISFEGAEAKYRVAEINSLMKRDSVAEDIIYEFAQSNSPHSHWIAKSFILLAEIYYSRGDSFSAKHALQTVLNSYENETDGVKDQASDLLTKIIDEEEAARIEQEYLNLRKTLIPNIEDASDNEDENGKFGTPVSPQMIEKDLNIGIEKENIYEQSEDQEEDQTEESYQE
jgi:tetratricopeptide (TPR) repeat protein